MKWPVVILVLAATNLQSLCTLAQQNSVGGKFHYGFIFAHSEHVQNTSGAFPRGLDLEFARQLTDTTTWDACRCYPSRGWNFSYFDYQTNILGESINAAYFLEPAYRIGKRMQFRLRGGIGLSYLTTPYHQQHNPTNLSYSMAVSGYLQLGVGLSVQVAPQWLMHMGGNYQHISNGGLKEPNKGINWPTASIGVSWMKTPYQLPGYNRRNSSWKRDSKPFAEAGLWLSAKQVAKPDGKNNRAVLGGVLIQASKQVSKISAVNVGAEVAYDHSLYQRLEFESLTGSPYTAGLLAGHEFLLGKFFFSQQLGLYLFSQSPYHTRLYHRWTLRYRVAPRWTVGFSLKAHKHVADFFDARVMYRFGQVHGKK